MTVSPEMPDKVREAQWLVTQRAAEIIGAPDSTPKEIRRSIVNCVIATAAATSLCEHRLFPTVADNMLKAGVDDEVVRKIMPVGGRKRRHLQRKIFSLQLVEGELAEVIQSQGRAAALSPDTLIDMILGQLES